MVAERTGSVAAEETEPRGTSGEDGSTSVAGTLAEGSEDSVVSASSDPWPQRRRIIIVSGLILAALTFDYFFAIRHGFFDLRVYHGALNYWADRGGSIYDFVLPFSTYGFTYPPFAALVMLPLAIIPWPLAIVLSCIVCAAVSGMVIYWFVDPVARRERWIRWYAMGIVAAAAIVFEPLRETFLFGQVNIYLVALVGADLLFLTARGSRFAGIGIGLATAIKLTPGIFIVYLLVTKRWRAALTASAAAAGATLVGAALAPDASRVFWTDALWNTDRVGALAFISNQSLNGAVARLNDHDPSTVLWGLTVVAVLAVWVFRVRRAIAVGDEKTGFALTGVVGCLVSPITWVHHLVWVLPAVLLMLDRAVSEPSRDRRRMLWGLTLFSYALLSSRLVWYFHEIWAESAIYWFFSNAYVWISLALLIGLPIAVPRGPATKPEPRTTDPATGDFDRAVAGLLRRESAPVVSGAKASAGAATTRDSVSPSG
jgi:alpha-1,2-mannosyltransferase